MLPIFYRNGMAVHRASLASCLGSRLASAGSPGSFLLAAYHTSGSRRLGLLLGAEVVFPACPVDQEEAEYVEQCAMSLWILNAVAQNFLVAAWRHRESLIGVVSVVGGRLVTAPPLKVQQRLEALRSPAASPIRFRRFWKRWIPHVRMAGLCEPPLKRRSLHKGKCNFFTVWNGRRKGVFYKWSDCKSSISGYPDPGFRGFKTLDEAYACYEARCPTVPLGAPAPALHQTTRPALCGSTTLRVPAA